LSALRGSAVFALAETGAIARKFVMGIFKSWFVVTQSTCRTESFSAKQSYNRQVKFTPEPA
jgi:hypothetical protein